MKPLQFAALVLTALSLIGGGAHLFALPNKIGLPQEQYFIVQAIYRGWFLWASSLSPASSPIWASLTLRADRLAPWYLRCSPPA